MRTVSKCSTCCPLRILSNIVGISSLLIVGSQQRDRPANHLFSLVTVNMLRALVPVSDDAVEILADDRVLRGIDDQREAILIFPELPVLPVRSTPVRAAQLLFDSYTVADVANCAEHHDSVVGWNRTQADLDGKLRSVPTLSTEVEAGTHAARSGLFGEAIAMVAMLLAETVGDENFDPLSDELVARVTKHGLGLGIGLEDDPLLIDRDDGVWNCLKQARRQERHSQMALPPYCAFRTTWTLRRIHGLPQGNLLSLLYVEVLQLRNRT